MKRAHAAKQPAGSEINLVEELSREYELEQFFQKLYQQRWKIVALISLCALLLLGGNYYQRVRTQENEKSTIVFFEQLEKLADKATKEERQVAVESVAPNFLGLFALATGTELPEGKLIGDRTSSSLLEYRNQLQNPAKADHKLMADNNIANLSREIEALNLSKSDVTQAALQLSQLLNYDISQNQRQRIELWMAYLLNHGAKQPEVSVSETVKE